MSLNLLLHGGLAASPDKPALVFNGTSTSYRALADAVDRSARGLLSLGVAHGDRVAIFMRNRAEFVELYLACFRVGAIAVPLNHRFQTDEVVFAVDHCAAKLLIVDGPLLPIVQNVQESSPSLAGVYVYGEVPAGAVNTWTDVVDAVGAGDEHDGKPTAWPSVADDDPAMILYTSGSTGKPKGVTHTHRSILATASGRVATQQLTADDISLAATAICHAGAAVGVAFPTLLVGGTVVILAESDPELFLDALQAQRPTRTILLPAQLLDAVVDPRANDVDFGCLREIQCGGDQISPDLYTEFAKVAALELNQIYGLTECEGAVMNPSFGPIERGSIGVPRDGVEVRVVTPAEHPTGEDVAAGRTGEIWIRGDSVMTGYWEDPEHTAATFVDGWLRTGDLGRRQDDGYLYFQGRIKEIIIKGGSNIAPGEVEDVLDAHPDVELSGVVGTPDARLGALVHAFVELKHGRPAPPTEHDLAAFAAERLAAYKVPDRWTFVTELPRNKVGKIDRHALHARAIELDAG
ncbi:class I adenylate-forming enzyme family protein [Agromyces laixinhei]|uniref:class I adenylate-forming enzyme family protein n=1 Tax=Agromyces laixinhei TaxID=2585717 RepID=UPI001117151C|nr:AMP-binding protein [Agromyces laixinhei]